MEPNKFAELMQALELIELAAAKAGINWESHIKVKTAVQFLKEHIEKSKEKPNVEVPAQDG